MDEALARAAAFEAAGADILFLEAPESAEEMRAFCQGVKRPALCNMLEQGKTPILPPAELEELGYKIAAYPLTLLSAAVSAMQRALGALARGAPAEGLLSFADLRRVVGFEAYYAEEERYADRSPT
jgi:2-methylisocitrate lyase-like PEP mutase family enzyme